MFGFHYRLERKAIGFALAIVLVASGLKLLKVPNEAVAITLLVLAIALFTILRFGSKTRDALTGETNDADPLTEPDGTPVEG